MAGSQNAEDNPVAINVVPMVDVIFCLCVFFMCSFKFKQLEGKFESWLPKDKGSEGIPVGSDVPKEIRIAMFWDESAQKSVRKYQTKFIQTEDELRQLISGAYEDYRKLGKEDVPVTIDSDARVPWKDVIGVVNVSKQVGVKKIEFAFGAK
jgi:biopolymer transport protein ExbD